VLAAVDAGLLPLARALALLTSGPARVLGSAWGRGPMPGLVEGTPADLVVFDRSETWTVEPTTLASRGKNTPLAGRELAGLVLFTVAGGRLAYEGGAD
jgi:dihydroorotase